MAEIKSAFEYLTYPQSESRTSAHFVETSPLFHSFKILFGNIELQIIDWKLIFFLYFNLKFKF